MGITPALKSLYNLGPVGGMRYTRCNLIQPWRPTYHLIHVFFFLFNFITPPVAFTSVSSSPSVESVRVFCEPSGIFGGRSINGSELCTVEGESNAGREEGDEERSGKLHCRSFCLGVE